MSRKHVNQIEHPLADSRRFATCGWRWSTSPKSNSRTSHRAETTRPGEGMWAPCAKTAGHTPKGSKSCDHDRNFDAISTNSSRRRWGATRCTGKWEKKNRKSINFQPPTARVACANGLATCSQCTRALLACVLWFRVRRHTRISSRHGFGRPQGTLASKLLLEFSQGTLLLF
jgi:hypothetical protein